jgi:beta-lactamase class A
VIGRAAPGSRGLAIKIDGRTVKRVLLRGPRFSVQVTLPLRETTVTVETTSSAGKRSRVVVPHVQGLPRAAAPRSRAFRLEPRLASKLRALAASYPGTSSFFVADLTTGSGAAWNAQAVLPAGSTLKLGIAVVALAQADGVPRRGSALDALLRRAIVVSDNVAANQLEVWIAGSTSAGSRRVNEMMRGIGLVHSEMYGGYIPGTFRQAIKEGIPLRADDQPAWGVGKRTTAYDLSSLLRAIWLASGNKGSLRRTQPGLTAADARYLLYLLARARDPGKLDRFVRGEPGVAVLHKSGWIDAARHDAGLVVWRGGIVVATAMTYRRAGTGSREDVLAGRLVTTALRFFRG